MEFSDTAQLGPAGMQAIAGTRVNYNTIQHNVIIFLACATLGEPRRCMKPDRWSRQTRNYGRRSVRNKRYKYVGIIRNLVGRNHSASHMLTSNATWILVNKKTKPIAQSSSEPCSGNGCSKDP